MNNIIFSMLSLFSYHAALKWTDSKLINAYEQGYKVYINEFENPVINSKIGRGLADFNTPVLGCLNYTPCTIVIKSETGEVIAGLISGTWAFSEPLYGNTCCIDAIWVDEQYRRQGLATKLLQTLMQQAQEQNCSVIQIDVEGYQEQAKKLFEKVGFKTVSTIPGPGDVAKFQRSGMRIHLDENHNFGQKSKSIMNNYRIDIYLSYLSHMIHYAAVQKVIDSLRAWIVQQLGSAEEIPFTLFVTSESSEIVGGAICKQMKAPGLSICYVEILWVNEQYRKHKLGSKIMQEVEIYAKSKDCSHIYLATGAWQARLFYEKLGFMTIATMPHPKNYSQYDLYNLRKELR